MISEETLKCCELEVLERFARWLQVSSCDPKLSKTQQKNYYVYKILNAIKRFKNYPRGVTPKEVLFKKHNKNKESKSK